jgi:hypothetical protein
MVHMTECCLPDPEPWWKGSPEGYEVLDDFIEKDGGEARLNAAYTPNNGIRVQIVNQFDEEEREREMFGDDGWDTHYRVFDFTPEQATKLGEALLRWAKARGSQ